jgi:hypothetical protein
MAVDKAYHRLKEISWVVPQALQLIVNIF